MFLALTLAALWLALTLHGPKQAPLWILIATGVPLLGLITVQTGPGPGLLCFVLGAWMLRRPLASAAPAADPQPAPQD